MKIKQHAFSTTKLIIILSILSFSACKKSKENVIQTDNEAVKAPLFFKLSLAQWSFHKEIRSGKMSPFDFSQKASEMGFEGVEYVSQLYRDELKKHADEKVGMEYIVGMLKKKSDKHNVRNVLIMVDGEGDLSSDDENERDKAVDNHKKWVDAAEALGCHSIRVNLSGSKNPEVWKIASIDGLSKLADYGAEKNINVIVENHGGLSSNAALLVDVIKSVNKPNCGVLPDFGNFCITKENGACTESYDKYLGVKEMMPFAKAVSAKSYTFDEKGNETIIDYNRMMQTVKDADYTGFIGVEYEGDILSEEKGVEITKNLLTRVGEQL